MFQAYFHKSIFNLYDSYFCKTNLNQEFYIWNNAINNGWKNDGKSSG